MSMINRKFCTSSMIVTLTATMITVAQPQPASAQLLEVAAGALNALIGSKKPQPQVIQQPVPVPVPTQPSRPEFSVGTNNANGNNFHFCLSNCLPSASTPVQPTIPTPLPTPVVIPQNVTPPIAQQPTTSTTVVNPNNPLPVAPDTQQPSNSSVSSTTIVNPNNPLPGLPTSQTVQQSSNQSAIMQN
ncbi:hypothetical protein NIES4102_28040 [Chondrocystis sp. NIES-4102]|nr:hypothetical protein NIES4102_28040 [Chondrocystis sp. NIES-4102]